MKIDKFWKNEWFWLLLILFLGIFLRFWKIQEWQHLTYDQSRDYIILKRILVDHKFTLVGPTVSIAPGFFLPPFYYYSLLPFLLLSNYHIVGPDVYTAVLGVFSIVVFYFLARDLFGVFPSLIAAFAYGLNPYLAQTSRHAWNPNTIFLFSLLFFLSFERYIFKKQRKWFLLSGFSLGWAIGLHLTAVVFLPLFVYLIYLEIKTKSFSKNTIFGIGLFLIIFSPLLLFDVKHDFPITKAGISYLKNRGETENGGNIGFRAKEMLIDYFKMPAVLLSGNFQKENMTVRPSNITAFSKVTLFPFKNKIEGGKLVVSIILWSLSIIFLIFTKDKKARILLPFLFFGMLIRLCFPADLFYFYYYLSVFPLVYLILAFLVNMFKTNVLTYGLTGFLLMALAVSSWYPLGIYHDPKPEKFFLGVSRVVAEDSSAGKKIAIAGNVSDKSRWEHNGLEYRFFAEALFGLHSGNWEAIDYKQADVLYFIDEGEVKDPLKFGGMEVEAFKPVRVEKVWKVETGQKVYKMTR